MMRTIPDSLMIALRLLAVALALNAVPFAQGQALPTQISPSESGAVISRKPQSTLPNFAGTWKINHAMSESPSPVFAKTEVTLAVAQTARQLTVEQKIKLNGHAQPAQPMTFNLDGKASEALITRPVAGLAKLSARWIAKENRLELRTVSKTTLRDEKGEPTDDAALTTIEYWELLEGGKLLKVVRLREWPEHNESSRLIFERQ